MVRSSGEPNQDEKSKPSSGITSHKEVEESVQKLVGTMHGIEPQQTPVNASLGLTATSEILLDQEPVKVLLDMGSHITSVTGVLLTSFS